MVGRAITLVYAVSILLAAIKLVFQQATNYFSAAFPMILFLVGAVIFFTSAETLFQFDRTTGYFLFKIAGDENEGLGCAGVFYTLFGLAFILMPTFISLLVLCTNEP